jgi:hypothetical protein
MESQSLGHDGHDTIVCIVLPRLDSKTKTSAWFTALEDVSIYYYNKGLSIYLISQTLYSRDIVFEKPTVTILSRLLPIK